MISILIPTYNRPELLAQALASVASQDLSLVGEVLIGDNSASELREANRATIAASGIAQLVEYLPHTPPKSSLQNQWFLAGRARCEHVLVLHDDDYLCPGGLGTLAQASANEPDPRVKLWFGRNLIVDGQNGVDMERTRENDRHFGKLGPGEAQPMWQWCLTQSVPPNCFLMDRETYMRFMKGARDGNVSDWGLQVRLANSGAWARFIAEYVSAYRVQADSLTAAGRGMDAHRLYELVGQLKVPPDEMRQLRARLPDLAKVATVRYLRDGERLNAWKCFVSPNWSWRDRCSVRGAGTALMLLTPRMLWMWALRYRA